LALAFIPSGVTQKYLFNKNTVSKYRYVQSNVIFTSVGYFLLEKEEEKQ